MSLNNMSFFYLNTGTSTTGTGASDAAELA
jgi:hypothetical protein